MPRLAPRKTALLLCAAALALAAGPGHAQPPPPVPAHRLPNLSLVCIGISQYLDASQTLLCPAQDALAVARVFRAQQGKAFGRVTSVTLTDRGASRTAIITALTALRRQAAQTGPDDYTIVYAVGHGTNDDLDQYFFAPYDIDADNIDATGVQWLTFSQTLAQLPGRVILMLDTCHSAGVSGKSDGKAGYGRFLVESTLAHLNNESPVIIFASCGKGELTQESRDWGHGAFAKALLDGLSGQADADHDGTVTLAELSDSVSKSVAVLTKDAQHPVLIKPASVPGDLPLAVLGPGPAAGEPPAPPAH